MPLGLPAQAPGGREFVMARHTRAASRRTRNVGSLFRLRDHTCSIAEEEHWLVAPRGSRFELAAGNPSCEGYRFRAASRAQLLGLDPTCWSDSHKESRLGCDIHFGRPACCFATLTWSAVLRYALWGQGISGLPGARAHQVQYAHSLGWFAGCHSTWLTMLTTALRFDPLGWLSTS
jgi:hypothetical protein